MKVKRLWNLPLLSLLLFFRLFIGRDFSMAERLGARRDLKNRIMPINKLMKREMIRSKLIIWL